MTSSRHLLTEKKPQTCVAFDQASTCISGFSRSPLTFQQIARRWLICERNMSAASRVKTGPPRGEAGVASPAQCPCRSLIAAENKHALLVPIAELKIDDFMEMLTLMHG